ncbi:unnamed protein product, partial [Prorocentrum cordatum]
CFVRASLPAAGVRATGPQASALPSKAAPARVGTPTPLAGGAWAKPSSTDCGPLSHLRHNAACELVSPDNSLRTYVGAASRPPPCHGGTPRRRGARVTTAPAHDLRSPAG